MTTSIPLGRSDRVLLFAPHPDDETLAAAGLFQQALESGAEARVIYTTSGGNNPWMQRLYERRWRVSSAEDKARYAALRRNEALGALACMGLTADCAMFLDYPDQGMTHTLLNDPEPAVNLLSEELLRRKPTIVAVPSCFDLHPDHSALAVLVRLAMVRASCEWKPRLVLHYIDHGTHKTPAGINDVQIALTMEQQNVKREALARHETQLALRRRWLLSFAAPTETFIINEEARSSCEGHAIRRVSVDGGCLVLEMAQRARPGAFGRTMLCLVSGGGGRQALRFNMPVRWRKKTVPIAQFPEGRVVGEAILSGNVHGGSARIPLDILQTGTVLFAKLERRFGFFDEAGWIEIPHP
ncbi:MAG: PIG-L family deacetylase [Candidatus Sumerlaeota bacterium]|nr:PIG-L family deacetylase [Candidatus Sumerlaeota bacterium]